MPRPPAITPLPDGSGARLLLPDGRSLGFCERGAADGAPLFWFPGTPGSRLSVTPDDDAAKLQGIRFIVVERPGFGVSTFQPNRGILSFPPDLAALAGALGIDRFAIAGSSGAGPYLAAAAFALPERVTLAGMIGVIGPPDLFHFRHGLSLRRHALLAAAGVAPTIALSYARLRRMADRPEQFYQALTRDAPPCDRRALAPALDRQVAMTAEALRPGIEGFVWELHLAARPWGFRLEEIRADVLLWHGALDAAAPIAMAREMARRIPRCRATFVGDAGHFLHFDRDRWQTILAALTR